MRCRFRAGPVSWENLTSLVATSRHFLFTIHKIIRYGATRHYIFARTSDERKLSDRFTFANLLLEDRHSSVVEMSSSSTQTRGGPKLGPVGLLNAWSERELLGSSWAQNEQSNAKRISIPPGLMPGSNMNAGLDTGPVSLGTVAVWCRAKISGIL